MPSHALIVHPWCAGLTVRTKNVLLNHGFGSKDEVKTAAERGELRNVANLGVKGLAEVCLWLGIAPLENKRHIENCVEYLTRLGYTVIPPDGNGEVS